MLVILLACDILIQNDLLLAVFRYASFRMV